ncbi:protein LSM14 homolog B-B [Frankliniella occidentalis]|uniref:Protein LSM14 homolog B-B n=1 Tax=Frankliniella occidentalis TaxID=133901 RepID=A0A9C6UAJ7_FRAOC|nr:protein LSM14 homolog B-B [Frankliniella occidentalis]
MNSGMPELGSKISLISKADIRYEGRLFTVDPQECTIALASVRSFGTEERETKYPVPAQNQVYDYILFRGSDIKDIRVVNTQPLNDPAIVQLSVPPSLGGSANFPGQPFPHPVLGHIGGPGPLGPYPQSMGPMGDLISGSRSSTPGLLARKSPTMDAGVQCSQPKEDKKPQNRAVQPPNRDGRPNQNRDRRGGDYEQRPQFRNYRDPQQQHREQNDYHDRNQRGQQNRGGGGWVNNRGMVRTRGRGRGGPNQNFQRAPGQQTQQQQGQQQQSAAGNNAQAQKKTLKFEGDYDFEQANTQFEELRSKLAKAKLDADQAQIKVNGEASSEKKDDSGNETGVEITEPEEENDTFYDKAKSFFDNISCEAVERSKGRSQRTDWRVERKLNSETFGVASARRGAYRGRGYYRGGMGGGQYRGGYRGNYRGNRGGYNQRSNQGNPNSTPANVQPQPAGK